MKRFTEVLTEARFAKEQKGIDGFIKRLERAKKAYMNDDGDTAVDLLDAVYKDLDTFIDHL